MKGHDDVFRWVRERYRLSLERIEQIASLGSGLEERTGDKALRSFDVFFRKSAMFIAFTGHVYNLLQSGNYRELHEQELSNINARLYRDIMPHEYDRSFANPSFACRHLGEGYGQIFSWLACEIRALIPLAFRDRICDMSAVQELFLTIYSDLADGLVSPDVLRDDIYWYVSDYTDQTIPVRIRETLDPSLTFYRDIIMDSSLLDISYLYFYGEPVTADEVAMAEYLADLDQETIDRMARTFVDGYIRGFEVGRIDRGPARNVQIRAYMGYERVIRAAIHLFEARGFECIIYGRPALHINRRNGLSGFGSQSINPQYDFDHSMDMGLCLDSALCERIESQTQAAYEEYDQLAGLLAGPAVMDVFGRLPFVPSPDSCRITLSPKQEKLNVSLTSHLTQIMYRHVDSSRVSFTIIAWPQPSIGPYFKSVMDEMIRVNTLDNDRYCLMQQKIIDAMDGADHIHISGRGDNCTDLNVSLKELPDISRQTDFENCLADVNIPLGEVFTSPRLRGTNGILHVSGVYLDNLYYKDLKIVFQDGFTRSLFCENYLNADENEKYVQQNLMKGHKSLPMGEFAIGTNTAACVMARRYGIGDRLPILIMEKTGPHFALGDTCYSRSEDRAVYNPDGREIYARDNEYSERQRKEGDQPYFNIHTDITIPYDEVGSITAVFADGRRVDIIRDGRFCLDGTQELNRALDEM